MERSSDNMAKGAVTVIALLFLALLLVSPFLWWGAMLLGMQLMCF